MAAQALLSPVSGPSLKGPSKLTADAVFAATEKIAVIGASTGCTEALNLAQDEASCAVFGMPKEVIKLGVVDKVLPLEQLAVAVARCSA